MPDPAIARKPKRRLWMLWPWIGVIALAIVGSVGWLKEKGDLEARLTHSADDLRAKGYTVSWAGEHVSGYPFRLDLTLDQPRIADKTGWALALPQLKGEAEAYDIRHWVFNAPQGFTLTRPDKGPLTITGQAVRASVSGLGTAAPRLSFQVQKAGFAVAPGAAPLPIASADNLEMHLQPGPDDQAAFLFKIDGGRSPTGGQSTLQILWDSRLSRLSQITGADWPSAIRNWIAAGGVMSVDQAKIDLGDMTLQAKPTPLTVGQDGHLQGALPVQIGSGGKLGGLFGGHGATLNFQNGLTTLGPLVLGPAPRVF